MTKTKTKNTTARKRARREANMATSTKSRAADRRKRPNYGKRKGDTKKVDECQLCDTPTLLKDQFTVVNEKNDDGEFTGKAIKTKIGRNAAKHPDKLSHYCADCATKRVKQKEAWVARRLAGDDEEAKPKPAKADKPKAKPSSRKRGAAKSEDKPKRSGRTRRSAKAKTPAEAKPEAKATSDADPF